MKPLDGIWILLKSSAFEIARFCCAQKNPDAVHQGFLVVARERLELSASGL